MTSFKPLVALLRQSFAGFVLRAAIGGVFLVIVGMTGPDFVAWILSDPPSWLTSWWFILTFICTLVAIAFSVLYWKFGANRETERQKILDELSRNISAVIHDLINRPWPSGSVGLDDWISKWDRDFQAWCQKITNTLSNRRYFTESDQIHFDRLGYVPKLNRTGHPRFDYLDSMLSLKIERLREVIARVEQRP